MVCRLISADMKRRALQLLDEGWEIQQIADLLGISSKSIHRWQDNYETHSLVNPVKQKRWPDWGLNPGPSRHKPDALTTELSGLYQQIN